MQAATDMSLFWAARSQKLRTRNVAELVAGTPIEGAHSLDGAPAYQRSQNG
jgi:hypothetical protein